MASEREGEATKTLTAQCLCKAVRFTLTVPTASLPIPAYFCHCSRCRYIHGTLASIHAILAPGIVPNFVAPSSRSCLTGYEYANAASTRYFCSTCGCHIGDEAKELDKKTGKPVWAIATSIYDDHSEDVFKIGHHIFTESAEGGGLYEWLSHIGDRKLEFFTPDLPAGSTNPAIEPEIGKAGDERLRVECHCGGVSFTLPRPTIPEVVNDPFVAKFLPDDPTRWKASLDLCDDCRLVNGMHIAAWTFIPPALADPPIKPDFVHGTLKTFLSSPGVRRAFCGTCGATVFFLSDDRIASETSFVADVPIGLLRAPEGVLAEKWVKWRANNVSYFGSGERYHPELARSLKQGIEEWALKKEDRLATAKIA